jgi:Flp pilus assembly protein TadG
MMSTRSPRAAVEAVKLARSRVKEDGGATLVEFAFSGVILFTLVFGIMVISIVLYSYHFVSEAAREGVRYAMVRGSGCSSYGSFGSDCPITAASAVQTYIQDLGFPGIKPSNLSVTTTWSTNGSAWTSSPAAHNDPGDYVKVVVSYQLPVSIPFVGSRSLTMNSTAETIISD